LRILDLRFENLIYDIIIYYKTIVYPEQYYEVMLVK
jgi:hypothetical protein